MLSVVTIHGEGFFDISRIVTPDRYVRPETRALVLHHTAGQTLHEDRNANGTRRDEQLAHIQSINQHHIAQGYGGFGYQGIAFLTGDVYVVGSGDGARAHVAHQNAYYEGLALAGTYTTLPLPDGLILAATRWIYAKWKQRGWIPVLGHREVPQQSTTCPGNGAMASRPKLLATVEAYATDRGRVEEQIARAIASALMPAASRGDVVQLASQIKWLTGGRLCGSP